MSLRGLCFACVVLSLIGGQAAVADPVLCGGRYYEFVDHGSGLSWADAKSAAESVDGHHLVTITSAEETACIVDNVFPATLPPPESLAWVGGQQAPEGSEPDGGWGWITGETWGYTNWASVPQQPDEAGSGEDCLEIYVSTDLRNPGEWNDYICGSASRTYYIVEWAGPVPAVSEWGLAVMTLLVLAAGTLVYSRHRTRQA